MGNIDYATLAKNDEKYGAVHELTKKIIDVTNIAMSKGLYVTEFNIMYKVMWEGNKEKKIWTYGDIIESLGMYMKNTLHIEPNVDEIKEQLTNSGVDKMIFDSPKSSDTTADEKRLANGFMYYFLRIGTGRLQ